MNTGNNHLYLYLIKGQLHPKYKTALRIRESLKEDCKVNLHLLHSVALLFQKQSHFPPTFWAVRQKMIPIFSCSPSSSTGNVCWLCSTSALPETLLEVSDIYWELY